MPKLFYIAGHGAGDPGATGNGYQEAERVRALGNCIKAIGGENVILGDFNRDYYADNGISTLNLPKDCCILEGHMDAGVATARGGHVIINAGLTADEYDSALSAMLQRILPGRANMVVGRNDLANPARAVARGFNYRLVEFGFITNAEDVRIFNSRMDDIARGVLGAFGIASAGNVSAENNTEGEEEMFEILKVKGAATHYYFDGHDLHPCATQKELDLIKETYKRNTGKDIKTHEYSNQADFSALASLLARTAK
ncbi:MAG: N-acetylmuramoyl-L-alanine amidase [Ruminococcus sp.]|nr:N-acetylmuramoyl-L-alanine amidase [Ruminococcus sp.]